MFANLARRIFSVAKALIGLKLDESKRNLTGFGRHDFCLVDALRRFVVNSGDSYKLEIYSC